MVLQLVRPRLRVLVASLLGLLAALSLLAPPSPARAEDPPTLAEAQQRVNDLADQLTVANEDLNRVRDALETSRTRQAELDRQLADERDRYQALESEVGAIGSVAYEAGPLAGVHAMLASSSPTALVDQLTYLNLLTDQRRGSIDALGDARQDVERTKNAVDAEVASYSSQENDLRTRSDQLDKDLAHWKDLRDQLSPSPIRPGTQATYYGQASGDAEVAVKYAYNQLGKPYEFGAAGPDTFDCSGLTRAAWLAAGVSIPHSSSEQYNTLPNKVAQENLAPGDLVIFYSDMHHVGIYIGSGQVIHAPQPGDVVRVANMSAMPFYGAVRP